MNTDHQPAFLTHAILNRDGNLRPAIVTARHWQDGDFGIAIRPLDNPRRLILLDRADINAVNALLRAQPPIPLDGPTAR